MKRNYKRWTKFPYAGESRPPYNPEEPLAGSWKLNYFKRNDKGYFLSPEGKPLCFALKNPNHIDWNNELKKVKKVLNKVTDSETEVATYWGTGVATKQWTPVIDRLIDAYGVTAPKAGRMLDTVHSAINDAFVITWDLKYKLDVARPNQLDHKLATVKCTPRHPTYPSGHSVIAGTVEEVLSYYFPREKKKLRHLALECAVSRLYGGVHFPADNDEGLRLGRQIGRFVVEEMKKEENIQGKLIDKPYRKDKKADIIFPINKQVIPFKFKNKCDSKLINEQLYHTPLFDMWFKA
jgi:hypothetical protein